LRMAKEDLSAVVTVHWCQSWGAQSAWCPQPRHWGGCCAPPRLRRLWLTELMSASARSLSACNSSIAGPRASAGSVLSFIDRSAQHCDECLSDLDQTSAGMISPRLQRNIAACVCRVRDDEMSSPPSSRHSATSRSLHRARSASCRLVSYRLLFFVANQGRI